MSRRRKTKETEEAKTVVRSLAIVKTTAMTVTRMKIVKEDKKDLPPTANQGMNAQDVTMNPRETGVAALVNNRATTSRMKIGVQGLPPGDTHPSNPALSEDALKIKSIRGLPAVAIRNIRTQIGEALAAT